MTIKAIETRYKGYRFRSRLEARWGVFFDAMGWEWEYEPEGYNLGEAGWYLPDFWLPKIKFHAETKPSYELISRLEMNKICAFDSHPPEGSYGVLLLLGPPAPWVAEWDCPYMAVGDSSTWHICVRMGMDRDLSKIARAIEASRSARFENGANHAIQFA